MAFLVARRFPERVRTLVLAEPGGSLDRSLRPTPAQPEVEAKAATFDDAAAHLRRGDVDSGLAIFVDIVSGRGAWGRLSEHAKQVMRDNAYTLLGQIREQRPPFTRSDVEAIQAPTLLVGAANSPPFYREILDALERHLKQVRRATIPDASHPMNHDNTGAFNGTVLDFLASYAG